MSDPVSEWSCPADAGPASTSRATESGELAALIEASATGDTTAFAEFYRRTAPRVYGLTLRVLRDAGYAEETTQEAFLQVWRSAATFDPAKGSAVAWVLTLAHRRAVDRVRAEQSSTTREATYETRNHRTEFDQVAEEVGRRSDQAAVLNCLEKLTATQRESLSIAYYGGRSYREVADELGIALPTAKSRIRDGLLRLRGCLGVM